ncbi:MAG: hypothetical protein Q8S27_13480 [Hoeflea sp.]|nr:hypothetical protein [Hoeflea sp.]
MSAPADFPGTKGRPAAALALFGREWLRAPLRVGAVALAQAVTAGMSAADGPVIELGPGTGAFVALNIPPATVYHLVRREDAA